MRRGGSHPVRRVRRLAADAFARSVIFALALIAGGFVSIGLAWRGAARSLVVAEQISFLVSGGVGGLAMILTGAGIAAIQVARYVNARERRELDRILLSAPRRAAPEVTTPEGRGARSRA